MKLAVRYVADYEYAEKASFSPHLARLFPRPDLALVIERSAFHTDEQATVQYRQDLFDNLVANCFYPEKLELLPFRLELDLEIREKNPFEFLLDSHAIDLPFQYKPQEAQVLAPFLIPSPEKLSLPEVLQPTKASPTVEAVTAMNEWLFKNIRYERRDEGDPFPPEQTLTQQYGSCRDYAVLLAEVLRRNGIASRLVSGYLWEDDSEDSPKHAENAFHAWVDAYLPGGGWIGFDPTNGVLCDHYRIATAVGLTPPDIAPILGHYYGKKTIASTLKTNLTITKIAP